MALFFQYCKDNRKVFFGIIGFYLIFFITFSLYRLPIAAVMYPTLLSAVLAGLFLLFSYGKFYKKHYILTEMRQRTAAMMDDLAAGSVIEEDYRQLIASLQKEIGELEREEESRFQDMVDYYTTWAHQIKTPIAAMELNLQNEDSPLSRRLRSDLFRIEQYVEMVLTYLRLDSSSTDYIFKEYSMDEIIRQAVKKFSHEFIGRKIALLYEPVEKNIVTDEKWLGFVLEQILSNALKYTKEGSIHIYFAQPHELCIEDTGMGIAPEDLPRIFQKGYTGYNGRSDQASSGIGLYLCEKICKNLGLGIAISSEIGKGTVVHLDMNQHVINRETSIRPD